MDDHELELKCVAWMEPKPTDPPLGAYAHFGNTNSPLNWWHWRPESQEWVLNKLPLEDIAAAMELLLSLDPERYQWSVMTQPQSKEMTVFCAISILRSTQKYPGFFRPIGFSSRDVPEQAICHAVSKLIDWLKENENV